MSNGMRLLPIILLLLIVGCKDSEQLNTIKGLREENLVIKRDNSNLQNKVKEYEEKLQTTNMSGDERLERLKKEHKDTIEQLKQEHQASITRTKEIHAKEISVLKGENADLSLKWGASQRENLVLREIVDAGPEVEKAKSGQSGYLLNAMLTIFIALAFFTIFIAYKWMMLRSHYQSMLTQIVAWKTQSLSTSRGRIIDEQ